ncbi:hypothetical protein FGO68_gene2063 [Halteria grandinella]|uniref:Uncharacterized protein n=1 Tax=Halteria grandinella TaxID=5974 RepID=A0A8J8NPM6_HALGN|nr:hypothetical protein FGO68_gene2063 [Halteria grandinella]
MGMISFFISTLARGISVLFSHCLMVMFLSRFLVLFSCHICYLYKKTQIASYSRQRIRLTWTYTQSLISR